MRTLGVRLPMKGCTVYENRKTQTVVIRHFVSVFEKADITEVSKAIELSDPGNGGIQPENR